MGFLDERKINESLMTVLLNGGDYNSLFVYANNELAKTNLKNSADYFPKLCGEDPDLMGVFTSLSEYSAYDHKGESFDYLKEARLINAVIANINEYKEILKKQYDNFKLVLDKKFSPDSEKKQSNRQEDLRFLGTWACVVSKGYLLLYIYLILQYLIPGYMQFPDEEKDRIIYAPASENDDEFYRADIFPLFTHYVCMSDIKKTAVKASPNMIGISNVARLYHYRISYMMTDNDKANVWVRLWKDDGEGLSPFYVKVNKVRTYVLWNNKYTDEVLWVGVLREALKYSGMDFESMTPAEVVYHCFGPEFAVSDVTQIAEDYKAHKISDEELFADLSGWVECGYPLTAAAASEYYCILGVYRDDETGKYLVNLYNPVHDADPYTAEFSEFFNTCTKLELNKSEKLKEEGALRIKGVDVLCKEDLAEYDANYLGNKSCAEYTKCFRDVYLSLIATSSMYEDASKEFLDLIVAARDAVVCMVWSLGCNRASFDPYLSYIRRSVEKYEESISGLAGNTENVRHDICGILHRIIDMFEAPGEDGLYPLTAFIREFSFRFSEKLFETTGKQVSDNDMKEASEMLMTDNEFLKLVSPQGIVKLCSMDEKQIETLVKKYIALKQR